MSKLFRVVRYIPVFTDEDRKAVYTPKLCLTPVEVAEVIAGYYRRGWRHVETLMVDQTVHPKPKGPTT